MYYRIKPFFVKFFGTFSVNSGVIVGNFYSEEGMNPPPLGTLQANDFKNLRDLGLAEIS